MNQHNNEYLPIILNVAGAIGVTLVSFLVNFRFSLSASRAKFLGLFITYTGMAIVVWAAVHIKGAFLGEVEPRLDVLVQNGPYRFVRHPVYLGMTIAITGIPVILRSWPGLIGVIVLFLPSAIYRAKLEEEALSRTFRDEWVNYAARTGFILPFIGKGRSDSA